MVKNSMVVAFTASALVATSLVVAAPAASAAVQLTMYDQATADGAAGPSMSSGLWGDFAGGVGARPYVERLAIVNSGVETELLTGGTPNSPAPTAGSLTTVVSPVNLCKTGSTSNCYDTPNRVSIELGSQGTNEVDRALSNVSGQSITAGTVIDMTVRLNTLGQQLRWSHANGELLSWSTSNLGTSDASLRIRFQPQPTPAVDWDTAGPNGCTATPINNCDIAQGDDEYLGASLLLSLDDTLGPELTGAVFGTTGAIFGFAELGGTAAAPQLGYQVASVHDRVDGSPNLGSLKAFIPDRAIVNVYGLLPEDAVSTLSASRTGSSGTNSAPTFTRWTTASNGSDGVLAEVDNITFSVPKYRLTRTSKPVAAKAAIRLVPSSPAKRAKKVKKTIITVEGAGSAGGGMTQCPKRGCVLTLRKINSRLSGQTTALATLRTRGQSATVSVPATKAPKGTRFLVRVSPQTGPQRGRVVGSVIGRV